MPLSFQVNKKDTRPLYEQLTGHIITLCRRSVLRPGDRLPPERDLAAQLHISRGTVKKAIESLKYQGYLESFQGSGNYVTTPRPPKPTAASTAEQAAEICSYAFFALQELHLPYEQISHLVHSYLERMERQCPQVRLALIDCAPETLRCCRNQLDQLPCVKLETYVLGDLEKDVPLLGEAATCDLIFTTSKHFEQMQKLLPSCEDRLYYFALAIPPNTIVQLATLSPQARVGVVCETERFYEIICQNLASLVPGRSAPVRIPENAAGQPDVTPVGPLDTLIICPQCGLFRSSGATAMLEEFRSQGGQVIEFSYELDQGSKLLIHATAKRAYQQKLTGEALPEQ